MAEQNDFSSLEQYLESEQTRINGMLGNVTVFGRLDDPILTMGSLDPEPPEVLQKAYDDVEKWWEGFKSGASAMGRLYQMHLLEYERKHGPRGVFSELVRLYPERTGEIEKDRCVHSDINTAYDTLSRKVSFLELSVQHWIRRGQRGHKHK